MLKWTNGYVYSFACLLSSFPLYMRKLLDHNCDPRGSQPSTTWVTTVDQLSHSCRPGSL
ncbi:hypothetical protein M2459_001637 [Parabacteroides sp. PF5-5]|nr:hypothetical protein [Parabacteroides sp. PH5-39]MDH6316014.1 hypothetical protein [Parabacteroides sp. PF5-13]MDH6319671.1 hypothetical protein [Parabacteroides sp. PH5-13]MDH6323402.1 hypothetical protein [Parabacteroides sp. PH5-8]MDH6327089.1 hypothetical protein [Parabacteroides sp. PH5-41]MDH6334891.1 hypothetical protein [Parabacteroides sp. PF5-5]MDH6345955.1 hypothetical protein [Parabacteroides sp. PH5-46]MDH6361027.1 hypothetical protein [Parabacteroides sp. PH5-16]MDH6376694.